MAIQKIRVGHKNPEDDVRGKGVKHEAERTQHPNWRRLPNLEPQGLLLFQKMVSYAVQM